MVRTGSDMLWSEITVRQSTIREAKRVIIGTRVM